MAEEWKDFLANGVTVPDREPIPQRKLILDYTDQELYLYLEGLKRFQNVPSTDPKSWYQIAGIHGLPYTTWPNEAWNKDIPGLPQDEALGFCTHSSILFLTWHRPYLALYEAILWGHVNDAANDIVDSEPSKQDYIAIAKAFRIPYWDWARKDLPIFPEKALYDKVTYNDPNFKEPEVKGSGVGADWAYNPLFQAPIPSDAPVREVVNSDWSVRYPGTDNPDVVMKEGLLEFQHDPDKKYPFLFPGMEANLTERVGLIMKSYKRFAPMCSNQLDGMDKDPEQADMQKESETYGSFEDFHNAVHGLTGGGGHMSAIEASANDPIFWLHHANIDRLFDIWQALWYDDKKLDTYVTERKSGMGTFTLEVGGEENLESPLYPFRQTQSTWHTSKTTIRTEGFGYTYPETAELVYPLSPTAQKALHNQISKLYPTAIDAISESRSNVDEAGADLLPQAEVLKLLNTNQIEATTSSLVKILPSLPSPATLLDKSLEPDQPRLRDSLKDNQYLEWLVNLKTLKHTLDGSFTVHIFLGPVEETHVSLYSVSPNHVGSFAPLGQSTDTNCGKCQQNQRDHLEVSGQIPLTLALLERYLAHIIDDLEETTVVEFLKKNLHWRVVLGNGQILTNRSQVQGLKVFVISNKVTLPDSEGGLPQYDQEVTLYPDITTKEGSDQGRGEGTGLTQGDL